MNQEWRGGGSGGLTAVTPETQAQNNGRLASGALSSSNNLFFFSPCVARQKTGWCHFLFFFPVCGGIRSEGAPVDVARVVHPLRQKPCPISGRKWVAGLKLEQQLDHAKDATPKRVLKYFLASFALLGDRPNVWCW